MARWILFRDRGAGRRPCEIARCRAADWREALHVLAPHALGADAVATPGLTRSGLARPFFLQSVASHAHEAPAQRLRARPFVPLQTPVRIRSAPSPRRPSSDAE